MKINMPVTQHEVMFDDAQFMLTKTDLKGMITYVNQDFVDVSGFSEAELIGSSHNIVRHPDMPVQAFADMWRNLKKGKPWTGLVKNRTKNGDFYWVEANAAPIFEQGVIIGYLSARKKPNRQEVAVADRAYQLFKENKATNLEIVEGKVVSSNRLAKIKSKLNNLSIAKRLYGVNALAVFIAITLVVFGLTNMSHLGDSLKTVYEDRMVPVGDLSKINTLNDSNRLYLKDALAQSHANIVAGKIEMATNSTVDNQASKLIEANLQVADKVWKGYLATYLTPEEEVLAARFEHSHNQYINQIINPGLTALRLHQYEQLKQIMNAESSAVESMKADFDALTQLQYDVATNEYKIAQSKIRNSQYGAFAILAVVIGLILLLGRIVVRSITNPIKQAIHVFGNIASGKLDTSIEVSGESELAQVLHALKITQTSLNVTVNAERATAQAVAQSSAKYENQLAAIASSTGVIELNLQGEIINVNQILCDVLNYQREELLGKPYHLLLEQSQIAAENAQQLWQTILNGEAVTGEFKLNSKTGADVWLQGSYNPILDLEHKPYKVVFYATDVTQQKLKNADFEGQMAAIGRSQAVVEVALDGTILKANELYLKMLGYSEHELVGKHASVVLDPVFYHSPAYQEFWNKLINGGTDISHYKRITKSGKEVWIQASYNPIYDLNGKVSKLVNYSVDITQEKMQAADFASQIDAIHKIQGVIEFDLLGNIIEVNDIFANVTGYEASELVGSHHSMLVEPTYKASQEYQAFWDSLRLGEANIGQYKRIGKNNKEIWLQASYNPIYDLNGKPFKVVKYATDITVQHQNADNLSAAVDETQAIIASAKSGDLSSRVPLKGKTGAIAALCDGVNALMDKMTEVIIQVREAGETINTAATEISTGNNDLSSRTEQQASSLEETAASMEELSATVRNNAENAKQANQLAAAASAVATQGGEVVDRVVNTMNSINESAKKIEDIISVIDGIAFQTNILALNAAVEAARAGEQGRGFAVVAGEVRNLAQRSATAAKEINELIHDSVSKTAEGSVLVETAGKTMQEIVLSVQRVTDIMAEISSASTEQSSGIGQVNQAVSNMDEMTQHNAALVEQAAAAAESLVDQAVGLIEVVSVFKLQSDNAQLINYPNQERAIELNQHIKTGTY
jgi:methyl-accepting chemotaxis protein